MGSDLLVQLTAATTGAGMRIDALIGTLLGLLATAAAAGGATIAGGHLFGYLAGGAFGAADSFATISHCY